MSRKRASNPLGLPPCMYERNGAFYLVKRGKWTKLGRERRAALIAYARLTAPAVGAMAKLIDDARPVILHGKRPSTVRQYTYALAQLAHMLADFEPAQVSQADLYDVMDQLRDTPNMANRVLTVAALVFKFAVQRRIIANSPAVGVDRLPERKRTRYLTDAEVAAIRAHAGARLRIVIDLLYLTGQRVNDVLDIRRSDLTDDGIRFKATKTGERKTVAWNVDLRAAVKAAKDLAAPVVELLKPDEQWLLRGRWGGRVDYRSTRDQWERACTLAGVRDAHIHDLRAKSATDAKAAGFDPQALLGHTAPAMTARYLRLRESPIVQGPRIGRPISRRTK